MVKVSLIVPCYQRPKRTLRAMLNVVSQDLNGWEAFFIGDGCPDFRKAIEEDAFLDLQHEAEMNGNKIHLIDIPEHHGGWGYVARNMGILQARGAYTMFMDNDDEILPSHFRNYYGFISNTDNDFCYFDTYIEPANVVRDAQLEFGKIGHHEIIVKTSWLRIIPKQSPNYGHDWEIIQSLVKAGAKSEKSKNPYTYIVKAIGGHEGWKRSDSNTID
jgi:glycosyltransferase involved in cell wall biosynthesis